MAVHECVKYGNQVLSDIDEDGGGTGALASYRHNNKDNVNWNTSAHSSESGQLARLRINDFIKEVKDDKNKLSTRYVLYDRRKIVSRGEALGPSRHVIYYRVMNLRKSFASLSIPIIIASNLLLAICSLAVNSSRSCLYVVRCYRKKVRGARGRFLLR